MVRTFYTLLSIILFISSALLSYGQTNCAITSDLWKDYTRFIPQEGTPIFTIRVNFVVPQRSDGSGNFSEDDPEAIYHFEQSMKKVNDLWGNLKRPSDTDCYTGDDFLDDTFVRFKLNAIIYIQDDFYWNADNGSGCPNDGTWYLNTLEKEIRKNPAYDNAINVYMPVIPEVYEELIVEKTSTDQPRGKSPCSELPTYKDLDRSSRICAVGGYTKYWWMKNVVPYDMEINKENHPWDPVILGWMISSTQHTMAHELGHSMGLQHANEYHGRNKCDESIMNQLFDKPHTYLQPTEIGKIHRNLRMSNIRNFLVEDVYSSVPMIIDEDMEFILDFKSYENIVIQPGVTLTVKCALTMHDRSMIIVEPGGKLVVDSEVSHRNGTNFHPLVELQKARKCFLKKGNQGIGELEILENGTLKGSTSIKKVRG